MITDMLNKAQAKQMEHLPFTFPLAVSSDNTRVVMTYATVTQTVQIARSGMNLLLQKFDRYDAEGDLARFVDRSYARELYRSDLTAFVNYLNNCYAKMCVFDPTLKDQIYLAAVNHNTVYGVVNNYNPKFNTEVLNEIQQHGLTENIKRWWITDTEMVVHLGYSAMDNFEVGLAVYNGETGHTALSYRLYIHNHDYTFDTPSYGRRKHLSNLEKVEQDITAAYAELSELKFYDYITHEAAYTYAQLILNEPEFEKLHDLVTPYDSRIRKLYQLLGVLATQQSMRGYKTLCTKALDKLYKEIMEHV